MLYNCAKLILLSEPFIFSVNKRPCLVPESPVSLLNCVMGNFAGFSEIMNVSGNFYLSIFSADL